MMRSRAFTLLEVMAVIVIMGLLSTAAMLLLSGEAASARRSDILDRISLEDRLARLAARRTGNSCLLRFDLPNQRVWRIDRAAGEERLSHSWQIPAAFRIRQILQQEDSGSAAGLPRETGTVDVIFSNAGNSRTYALQVTDASDASREPQVTWLVFAGLSGQRIPTDDEAKVKAIFASLAARSDAR